MTHLRDVVNFGTSVRKISLSLRDRFVPGGYVAVYDKCLNDLDVFAKKEKAEEISDEFFDDELKYIDSKIQGSKSFHITCFDDKIFKFKLGYICRFSYLQVVYGDVEKILVHIVIASSQEKALSLIDEYYRVCRLISLRDGAVMNQHGEKITNYRKMDWSEIFLKDGMVDKIRQEIVSFFKSEDMYKKRKLVWKRGILLSGSPGNGKTSICRAISSDNIAPVIYCSLGSESRLHNLLDGMQRTISINAPCIAVYEDADLFGSNSSIRAATLNMLDGLFTIDGVLTIATTNDPNKLDNAFTSRPSRFDSYYVVENPGPEEIASLLKSKLQGDWTRISQKDQKELISQLVGFSAAFVQEIAVFALLKTINLNKKVVDIKILRDSLDRVKNHVQSSKNGDATWSIPMGFSENEEDD